MSSTAFMSRLHEEIHEACAAARTCIPHDEISRVISCLTLGDARDVAAILDKLTCVFSREAVDITTDAIAGVLQTAICTLREGITSDDSKHVAKRLAFLVSSRDQMIGQLENVQRRMIQGDPLTTDAGTVDFCSEQLPITVKSIEQIYAEQPAMHSIETAQQLLCTLESATILAMHMQDERRQTTHPAQTVPPGGSQSSMTIDPEDKSRTFKASQSAVMWEKMGFPEITDEVFNHVVQVLRHGADQPHAAPMDFVNRLRSEFMKNPTKYTDRRWVECFELIGDIMGAQRGNQATHSLGERLESIAGY